MTQKSPQELFPNLFGKQAQARPAQPLRPQAMRLLQYCLRQAATTRRAPAAKRAPAR